MNVNNGHRTKFEGPNDERPSMVIIGGENVLALLKGKEPALTKIVRDTYLSHAANRTALPRSSFLRLSEGSPNRIIALPAALEMEDKSGVAGMKWISSFPGNLERGFNRASGAILLNSTETGFPFALLEGSVISAKRTAASAALAAGAIHGNAEEDTVGLVGCGIINAEILRFLKSQFPNLKRAFVHDIVSSRVESFAASASGEYSDLEFIDCDTVGEVLSAAKLVSFATTVTVPVLDIALDREHTILHVSLRDLLPQMILRSDNVTDDIDHVLHAQTSLHLAEQLSGSRSFVRCNLADILSGKRPPRAKDRPVIFSPFGLGILDLAMAFQTYKDALREGRFVNVEGFHLPAGTTR